MNDAPLDPDSERFRQFVLNNTSLQAPPHVPEIRLCLADEAHDLWHKTEEELAVLGLPPPYWAFAWAGGQAVARYVIDHPGTVAGLVVLDFASGSGLVGIAAARAGAAKTISGEIDRFAGQAIGINAAINEVGLELCSEDLIGKDHGWDVILAGDVFYEKPLADRLTPWFDRLASRGAVVLVGDPGRSYLPKTNLEALATYTVAVTRALEDSEVKKTTVWAFRPTVA